MKKLTLLSLMVVLLFSVSCVKPDVFEPVLKSFTNTVAFYMSTGDGVYDSQIIGTANDIAVDNAGRMYITDTFDRVVVLDSDGNYVRIIGSPGTGDGELNNPCGIALDKNGNVYVTSYFGANHVTKFSNTGTFLMKISDAHIENPTGITVDDSGKIYVAGTDSNNVVVWDKNGNFLLEIGGTSGTGNGEFIQTCGVAVDQFGRIFVSDFNRDDIQVFDASGKFLYKIGGLGTEVGEFTDPTNVFIDKIGYLYVSDSNNDRVQKMRPDGTNVITFGEPGTANNQFQQIFGLFVDDNLSIYVVDEVDNDHIKIFKQGFK